MCFLYINGTCNNWRGLRNQGASGGADTLIFGEGTGIWTILPKQCQILWSKAMFPWKPIASGGKKLWSVYTGSQNCTLWPGNKELQGQSTHDLDLVLAYILPGWQSAPLTIHWSSFFQGFCPLDPHNTISPCTFSHVWCSCGPRAAHCPPPKALDLADLPRALIDMPFNCFIIQYILVSEIRKIAVK